MKLEEKIAENFLIKQGFNSIIFEPLGKSKPPDFLIEEQIAIEVRRLNKHVKINGKSEPIEFLEFKFVPKFKRLLKELEQSDLSYSIGVTLRYKRPIIISKQLFNDLKKSIILSTQSEIFGVNVKFNDQITYVLFKGNGKSNQTYELIIKHDIDKGGIVQDSRYEALKTTINKKANKMKHLKGTYSKFWLILIDDIFSRVDETINLDLLRFPEIKSFFNRIIIISKSDSTNWIDLCPWNEKI